MLNYLVPITLVLASASAHADGLKKHTSPNKFATSPNASAPPELTQTELMREQFPEGTTCQFQLSREQLQNMKPGGLYVPAGNVITCRQPFDSTREDRPLQV